MSHVLPYAVEIAVGADSAFDDLVELPRPVREELLEVMRTEFRGHQDHDLFDGDGGNINGRWFWRRGVTRARRRRLDGEDWEATEDRKTLAVDFVIVYREFTPQEERRHRRSGFYIKKILPNEALANMILRGTVWRGEDAWLR